MPDGTDPMEDSVALQRPEIDPIDGPPPSDLVVEDLWAGDGAEATAGRTVEVHYVGVAHSSGEEFDASWNRGSPLRFPLRLVIPPQLGYGDRGAGGAIKPGETLIFVVDLVSVA